MCRAVRKVRDMMIYDALMCWFNSEYTTCRLRAVLLFYLLQINKLWSLEDAKSASAEIVLCKSD